MANNFCILLIGKSGSGKTTLAEMLARFYNWTVLESYTDRPRRSPSEVGHRFVPTGAFNAIREKEGMVAYNTFDGYQYGVTAEQVDEAQIYVVDIPGYLDLLNRYKSNKVFIPFYLDTSESARIRFMAERGDADEAIRKRLIHDEGAFAGIWKVPHHVLSGARPINEMAYQVKMAVDKTMENPQHMWMTLVKAQVKEALEEIAFVLEDAATDNLYVLQPGAEGYPYVDSDVYDGLHNAEQDRYRLGTMADVLSEKHSCLFNNSYGPAYVVDENGSYVGVSLVYRIDNLPMRIEIDTYHRRLIIAHDDAVVAETAVNGPEPVYFVDLEMSRHLSAELTTWIDAVYEDKLERSDA